jgi:hypothetical protein
MLRPSYNVRTFPHGILHISCVVHNAREDPVLLPQDFHAKRGSPQTGGDLNISNYTIPNTFKFQARSL